MPVFCTPHMAAVLGSVVLGTQFTFELLLALYSAAENLKMYVSHPLSAWPMICAPRRDAS